MEIRFIVTKEERKALVAAIGEVTGLTAVYKGAPSFAFAVGDYIVDRTGALIFDERMGAEEVRSLLDGLSERGFAFEADADEGNRVKYADARFESGDDSTPDSARFFAEGEKFRIMPDVSGQDEVLFDVSERNEPVSDDLAKREVISEADESGDNGVGQDAGGTESGESASAEPGDPGKLSINMPLTSFTASSIDNLYKLVAAKAWIIKKMAGTDELPIEQDGEYLYFPWFKRDASAAEVDAYSRLIAGLCGTAKKKQRVTAAERRLEDGDNEKFKARCFLLSLDFIGKDYAQARKILLAPMSGSGSFKSGNQKRADAPKIAGSGEERSEAITVHEADSDADSAATDGETAACDGDEAAQNAGISTEPSRCGGCFHHRYYTDGLLRSAAGDVVDTSKRTPDKYTHYCLKAPSGFRKIKHAAEWSGFENAPKWCPLHIENTNEEAGL